MDDTLCQQFFLQPSSTRQRQYEALRAVFVDGTSQKETAQRFGYSYDAFRQLIHQFREACFQENPPPFLPHPVPVAPQPSQARSSPPVPSSLPGLMSELFD